jgi:hypothetical protein
MAKLTSQQATGLANNFLGLAKVIGDFRYKNWNKLTKSEKKKLAAFKSQILKSGEDILAISTNLVMDDVQTSLEEINSLSSQIKGTVENLKNIQKGINIAASIVILGSSLISRNPKSIIDAIIGITDTLNG